VKLIDKTGTQISAAKTNMSGVSNFTAIPAGTGYSYRVYYLEGKPPFGEQFWGRKTGLSVLANQTTNESFLRNAPYAPAIAAYDVSTNAEVTGDTIAPGTAVRVELTIKNPNNPGALSASSRARFMVESRHVVCVRFRVCEHVSDICHRAITNGFLYCDYPLMKASTIMLKRSFQTSTGSKQQQMPATGENSSWF